jgi:hypothetical protein
MYHPETPKLFELSQLLIERLMNEVPDLYEKLIEHEVVLEAVLASPLMTLFSNLLTFSEATHVLNMFILEGEAYIMELLMNIMRNMAPQIT